MAAERGAQRGVKQVCCRVVACRLPPHRRIHLKGHGIANTESALFNDTDVNDELRALSNRPLGVRDAGKAGGAAYHADIANLPATLRIERRASRDDLHLLMPGG